MTDRALVVGASSGIGAAIADVLTAGGLIIGNSRISLSRILGAPQEECSFLIPRIVRSTW